MSETKRTKFIIEVDLSSFNSNVTLQCGLRIPGFILLEDIWLNTGCDTPGEKGHWVCYHCSEKYFFYLFNTGEL